MTSSSSFSYFCLSKKDNLCVGVSVPVGGSAFEGIYMQLKSYSKSRDKGVENKRMRWRIDPSTHALQLQDRLAMGDTLCASPDRDYDNVYDGKGNVPLRLYSCRDLASFASPPQWTYDASKAQLSTQYRGQRQCMMSYDCSHGPNNYFCRLRREIPKDFGQDVIAGAYLGLSKCVQASAQPAILSTIQSFSQDFNCTMDCSQDLLANKVCDAACDYDLCEFDAGWCTTPGPTSTRQPTAPTTLQPTFPGGQLGPPGSEDGDDVQGGGFASTWLLLLLILVLLLVAWCVQRRRRRTAATYQQQEGLGEGLGGGGGDVHHDVDLDGGAPAFFPPQQQQQYAPVKASVGAPVSAADQQRFETSSAVALNQLRYHSRASAAAAAKEAAPVAAPSSSKSSSSFRHEDAGQV